LERVAVRWPCSLLGDGRRRPQRIVSLAPSLTETVFALGLGDRLVGVSVYCDYPPEAQRIDRVGTFITPNVEAIVAKRPDVILAVPSPGNRSPVESLERLGFKVVVVDPLTLEAPQSSFRSATLSAAVHRLRNWSDASTGRSATSRPRWKAPLRAKS
jgi:ABC-type hemin transport system substrate-binding protein